MSRAQECDLLMSDRNYTQQEMATKPDKRQRSDLDAFVLALLIDGIATPYEMQSLAGISPGASIPALQRLVAAAHARASKPGSRNRVAFNVTAKGKKWLDAAWLSLVEAGPTGDFDSDLRIFLLAIYKGRDRRVQANFSAMQQSEGRGH